MSVSGISSTNFLNYTTQNSRTQMQKLTQEFQQLGADLQSGNLSAAQADFATLQRTETTSSTSSVQSNNPIAQLSNQLSQDLKSGNLSAIQQDFKNQNAYVHHHHSPDIDRIAQDRPLEVINSASLSPRFHIAGFIGSTAA